MWKKILQQRLYMLLLLPAAVFSLYALFGLRRTTGIHIHDTMLVFYMQDIYRILAFCFIAAFLVYEGRYRSINNKRLILLHVFLTFLLLAAIVCLSVGIFDFNDHDYSAAALLRKNLRLQFFFGSIYCLLYTLQFLLLFNLLWGIIYTIRAKQTRYS